MRKFDQQCCKVEHRQVWEEWETMCGLDHSFLTNTKKCYIRDVCVSKSLIFKVRVCFLPCCVRSVGNAAPVFEKKQEMAVWCKTSRCTLWWICAVQNVLFSCYSEPSAAFDDHIECAQLVITQWLHSCNIITMVDETF